MSDPHRDPVDDFFDSIGAEQAPPGRPAGAERTRGQRDDGRRDRLPVIAAVVALALLVTGAFLVTTRKPDDRLAVPPSAPTSTSAPSDAIPSRTPRPLPTPVPTPAPPVLATWDLVEPLVDVRSMRLRVADQSGDLLDARVAVEPPTGTRAAVELGPFDLDIRQVPGDPAAVWVGWGVLVCEYRGELRVAPGARELALQFAPAPGCDLAPISQGLVLSFNRPIDATAMTGREIDDGLVAADDLLPRTIAFADAIHGWVGGTTAAGDAMVIKTDDGGVTWLIAGLGEGTATDLGAIDPTHAMGARACDEVVFNCRDLLLRWDEEFGGWAGAAGDRFVRVAFRGQSGAGVIERRELRELATSDRGGDLGWEAVRHPCDATSDLELMDAERPAPDEVLILCAGAGTASSRPKWLLGTTDEGEVWTEIASTEAGTLPPTGIASDIDLRPEGDGWLWGGGGSQMLVTDDGGTSWGDRPAIDGDGRIEIVDASYLGEGSGLALVADPAAGTTRLLRTDDSGFTWTHVAAWSLG